MPEVRLGGGRVGWDAGVVAGAGRLCRMDCGVVWCRQGGREAGGASHSKIFTLIDFFCHMMALAYCISS